MAKTRRTLAATGHQIEEFAEDLGKMLGHARSSTTERYAHLAPDPVKAAAASVAAKIADGLRVSGGAGPVERAA
jgi:hypothetical protein